MASATRPYWGEVALCSNAERLCMPTVSKLPGACDWQAAETWRRAYFHVSAHLDLQSACRMDEACRQTLEGNGAVGGPWWQLGCHAFANLELHGHGPFECLASHRQTTSAPAPWKRRYVEFARGLHSFRLPFGSPEITEVDEDDCIAYLRSVLRVDRLEASAASGLYLEVEVLANPDNFSLAVVDFEAGGSGSLTFSPDTGAVINEQEVSRSPRDVQGKYIQPLEAVASQKHFLGSVGLFLQAGRLAFFRRQFGHCGKEGGNGAWESTGFVADLAWAAGSRVTPCIAFRSAGAYRVRMSRFGAAPPVWPTCGKDQQLQWMPLDWEADLPDVGF